MNALYLQTALLMAGAYLTGAVLACLLRKVFGGSRRRADAYAKDGVATGPAAGSSTPAAGNMNTYQPQNISRPVPRKDGAKAVPVMKAAATPAPTPSPTPAAAASAPAPSQLPAAPPEPEAKLIKPSPLRVPVTQTKISKPERSLSREIASSQNAARFERSLSGPVADAPAEEAKPSISTTTSIAAAVAAAAVVTTAASAASADVDPGDASSVSSDEAAVAASASVLSVDEPTGSNIVVEPKVDTSSGDDASGAQVGQTLHEPQSAAIASADDLQDISRIDAALAGILNEAGITKYSQIAAWNASEVEQVNAHLGVRSRVQKENWIEQAQVLAAGGQTIYSRGRQQAAAGVEVLAPVPVTVAENPIADATDVATVAATAAVLGVVTKPQDEPAQDDTPIGDTGIETAAAVDKAPPASDEPSTIETAAGSDDDHIATSIAATAAAAASAAAAAVEVATLVSESSEDDADDEEEQPVSPPSGSALPETGPEVTAAASEIAEPVASPAVTKSVEAEVVVSAAAETPTPTQASGESETGDEVSGETASSWSERAQQRAATERRDPRSSRGPREARPIRDGRGDIGSMRSVRSQALRSTVGRTAGEAAGAGTAKVVSSVPDDLKRVRGVGVLIERKLNSLGVTSYEQIANWTAEQVADISHKLDFKGRIERENWVEQARILAAGGYTEFSSRVDRGEVDSSKNKG